MTEPIAIDARIRALRGVSGESHDATATRQRIVSTLSRRRQRRHQLIAFCVLTFVGLPLGTTAYAAFFGTPAIVERWLTEAGIHVPTAASTPSTKRTWRAPTRPRPREHSVMPAKPEPAPALTPAAATQVATRADDAATVDAHADQPVATTPPNDMDDASRTTRTVHDARNPAPRGQRVGHAQQTAAASPPTGEEAPVTGPVTEGDPSEALYARAHALHFVAHDWSAALAAWDAYLTDAPNPTLLPEAKYNRALCLIRMRRNAEAIDALAPFASGSIDHGYRKREAHALIHALTNH